MQTILMTISPSAKLTASPDALVNVVNDESVLLDLKTERYFGLNESGTRMWAAILENGTIDGACAALAAEYDTDPAVLRQDLETLVEKLVERGLVHVDAA